MPFDIHLPACATLLALLPLAGCFTSQTAAADASAPTAASTAVSPDTPEALQRLLARYDRMPAGPAKDELAAEIDRAAHQKYATISRLYWHTDLASAQAAARASNRPILHLRMLGRLDEDLSCANSRLFRATLYANREVSAFLRDNFVLYWSSERPVPRVTIDYGDGRKLERTTTGNSAHYVMDADGNVLDVLPGLYAPTAFMAELKGSLALAASVHGKSDEARGRLIARYHEAEHQAAQEAWYGLADTPYLPSAHSLLTQARVDSELAIAQRATISKAMMEISDLQVIAPEIALEAWPEHEIAMWASAGQRLYAIGDLKPTPMAGTVAGGIRLRDNRRSRSAPTTEAPPRVLDEASRALVMRLHDAVPAKLRSTNDKMQAMIERLEQHIVADTAINQLRLRPRISAEIAGRHGRADFETLNAWVYTTVFRTPKTDPWLGLLPRTDFTGLPGDGVVMR